MSTWLEEQDIGEQLGSGNSTLVKEALAAIDLRVMAGENLVVGPLTAANLLCFQRPLKADVQSLFLTYIWPQSGILAHGVERIAHELALLCAQRLDNTGAYGLALEIKVQQEPARVASLVVAEVDAMSAKADEQGQQALGYLVACLLDGEAVVQKATFAALKQWSPGTKRRLAEWTQDGP